jgi:ABC-type nitrate/sulfonate/bicarbonate transport system permease component
VSETARATSRERDLAALARRLYTRAGWTLPWLGLLLAGLIWEFVARVIVRSQLLFATLTSTLAAAWDLFASGSIYPHLAISAQEFAIGFVISVIGGVALGAVFAAVPPVGRLFSGVVQAAYATPLIAVAPLLIVLFGIGIPSKIIVVVLLAVFPVLISTESAFRSINPEYIETALAFGAGRFQVLRKVVLPAASIGILTGVRLAVGRGIIGVVVGEIFGSFSGLGFLIVQYSQAFQTAKTLAVVLILAVIGVVTNVGLLHLENRLSPWRQSKRAGTRIDAE